ncbi:HNH endonuclease family protein [Streptosporangium sp. NPDC087985]|uniref:HNH endonuclease family protein n=1 Tax=Streptosporangium sp. NPDC087985 TaxID=3366196 RepID=UPI00381F6549
MRDPYTGRTIQWSRQRADEVQVDHVVPLSYEWRMGASRWPMAKRMRIANDPLNLIPVYGKANEAKGGSGPASWLPPVRRVRCAYVVRFAQVAVKYDLPVTRADKATMLAQCR